MPAFDSSCLTLIIGNIAQCNAANVVIGKIRLSPHYLFDLRAKLRRITEQVFS
jgi:hypothetical protein